ncbi:methyltransferase [Luteimonas sp. 3794]|uniref:class I SAM-dependent methyltransferase n=1 Tax=Luteimonas sp. 3794 TaxID=2817730 RepID=UPI0028634A4D|nr:methyltransferase [Luteimonas sp. 3794]MDR6991845.1 SAM-dependent methyltransferase [Luteimonas sp. 3794]
MTDMQKILAAAGYTRFEDHVWGRGDFAGIAYSDGDSSEDGLLSTLREARDVSVFSPELRAACTDWPSFYHLSNERSNLLRPFSGSFAAKTRVLEIGAGCGAVTRFLGETGAQVLALEGSRRRAAIARERARGLDNVQVLAERFQDFAPETKFDVITLIGVLEYANVFSQAPKPALDMLRSVRAMLAPGGSMFLAIENKFGLKYLAGAPEDHLGTPMVGVEGRYRSDGVRTWGRGELDALLSEAGFARRDFHVPMPDYKTPVSIIGPSGLRADPQEFDAGTLAAQAVRRDRQLGATTFNLQRAWTGIGDNRLLLDLGNSFLVRAGDGKDVSWNDATLAWHYSTQRAGMFARESRFVREDNGCLSVHSRALSDQQADDGDVRMRVSEVDAYHRGPLLVEEFRAVLTRPGWALDELADVTARYLRHLRDILAEDGVEITTDDPSQVLPDRYIDATPFNLVSTLEGRMVYFDREWEVPSPTLGWLTLRSLLFTYAGTAVAPMQSTEGVQQVGDFVRQVLSRVFPGHGQEWVEAQLRLEEGFQSAVTGVDQHERLREVLEIGLPTDLDSSGPVGSSTGSGILLQQLDLVSQSLHTSVAHVGDRVGSVLEQQDAMSQSLHAVTQGIHAGVHTLRSEVAVTGQRVDGLLEQLDTVSQSLHAGVAHIGDRVGSVLEQQDALSQSLHAGVAHVGDRLGSVLEQQDALSQSLHAGVAHVGDRVGSVLEQQDAISQSLHAVAEGIHAGVHTLRSAVTVTGQRVDGLLEQLDTVSQSLHAGVGHVGDRVGSVLEQQDAISQSLHAVAEGIHAGVHTLRSAVTVTGQRVDGLLEQLDTVSQSLHAVTQDLASGIQAVQGDVVLANERADGLLKQLDAVSQSLHAATGRLGGSVDAIGSAMRDLSAQQLATRDRLETVGADLEHLKRRSVGGILRRMSGWFRRVRE